jgi:hypothetical protein
MRLKQLPSHGTVVAYLALFIALAGSAYAVSRVDSADVVNDSLKSKDLKDGKAVAGRDVRSDSLTGKHIREGSLDASELVTVTVGSGGCDPSSMEFSVCAQASVDLERPSKVLAIASGGFYSEGGPANSSCGVGFNRQVSASVTPGESASDNSSLGASDGFATTRLSETLPAGSHSVTLECNQVVGDARISGPVIAALAVGQ